MSLFTSAMENYRRPDCRRIKDNCLQISLWVGSTVLTPPFTRNSAGEARTPRNTATALKIPKISSVNEQRCFFVLWVETKEQPTNKSNKSTYSRHLQNFNRLISILPPPSRSTKISYCILPFTIIPFIFSTPYSYDFI